MGIGPLLLPRTQRSKLCHQATGKLSYPLSPLNALPYVLRPWTQSSAPLLPSVLIPSSVESRLQPHAQSYALTSFFRPHLFWSQRPEFD